MNPLSFGNRQYLPLWVLTGVVLVGAVALTLHYIPLGKASDGQDSGSGSRQTEDVATQDRSKAAFRMLADARSAEDIEQIRNGTAGDPFVGFQLHSGDFAEVVRKWMERDPLLALDLIAAFPAEDQRAYAVDWSADWFSKAPREFLQFADDNLSPSNDRKAWHRVMAEAGKHCPETAMAIIQDAGQGERKEAMIGAAFYSWAEKRPEAALEAVATLPFPEDRKEATSAIANAANKDFVPLLGKPMFLGLPDEARKVIGEAALRAVAAAGGEEEIARLYADDSSLRQYGAGAIEGLAARNWESFVAGLDGLVERGIVDYSRDSMVIGRGIAQYLGGSAGLDFVRSLPAQWRSSAACAMADMVANSNDNGYLDDVLREVPAGAPRAAAAEPLLRHLRMGGNADKVRIQQIERILAER